MKPNVSFVYWTLLCISVFSSAMLFLIVAAENGISIGKSTSAVSSENEIEAETVLDSKPVVADDKSATTDDLRIVNLDTLKQEKPLEEIHSSFDDLAVDSISVNQQRENTDSATFQHASVSEELSETGHAVVYTLVDSASQELKQQAAASSLLPNTENDTADIRTGPVTVPMHSENDASNDSEVYIVRAEPKQLETTPSEMIKEELTTEINNMLDVKEISQNDEVQKVLTVVVEELVNDSMVVQPKHEEIPSFSEWAEAQLAAAEKKKGENKTHNYTKRVSKLRSKNFASPDCGAKVVATNPEAGSAWAVLSPSRDEYLLNSCKDKIWFVVELCEAVQPKKIELANFELFSSILREFSVSVSDRYPSREWTSIGQFEGNAVRTVQNFNVQPPTAFYKYIKVEFHSHYGTEHYCPISLFRVYGTSEFEILDNVDEAQVVNAIDDEDDDEFEEGESLEKPKNLFSSARDAVLSIVKIATDVLVKREGELETNTSHSISQGPSSCCTPAYIVVCDNCSDEMYHRVHEILSCKENELHALLESKFIRNTIANSDICASLGLDLRTNTGLVYPTRPKSTPYKQNKPSRYIELMLSIDTVAALCNTLAIVHRKVVLNITYESTMDANETVTVGETDIPVILPDPPSTCSLDSTIPSSIPYDTPQVNVDPVSNDAVTTNPQIKPTKTFTEEQLSAPVVAQVASLNASDLNQQNNTTDDVNSTSASQTPKATVNEDVIQVESTTPPMPGDEVVLEQLSDDATTGGETISFDSLFSELDEADPEAGSSTQPSTSPPLQRDSVFVRLAKRIKALERNMSLSGQYLEELSRRYKRQVEEMQRTLTDVIEDKKKGEEKEERRSQQLLQLTEQVATLTLAVQTLTEERNSWMIKHWFVIIVEVFLCALVIFIWQWLPDIDLARQKINVRWARASQRTDVVQRRKSVDEALNNTTARMKKRRPSEEALRISGSTHQELLIEEGSRKNSRAETRRRRRKKKEQLAAIETSSIPSKPTDDSVSVKYVNPVAYQSEKKSSDVTVQEPVQSIPPPPPLPSVNDSALVSGSKPNSSGSSSSLGFVNMNGNTRSLILPAPAYIQTAVSFRKQRTVSQQSSVEGTDRKEKSSNNSSSKKSGPFKKIVKKFFD